MDPGIGITTGSRSRVPVLFKSRQDGTLIVHSLCIWHRQRCGFVPIHRLIRTHEALHTSAFSNEGPPGVEAGSNFINAFVLGSQNLPIRRWLWH